uniref:Uncharacterized protein n=1 Tax=Lymantria dispar multicapsid nuclear polyhedrosis virus TaxID=10449 RepID=A0A7S8F7U1_NPVLD|nr:hypothetical protein [Lymantria dispar multiple nucleopolyhedrovirus]QPD01974.1 hypothetical protein [Lymantria dispar multiple nucleopolyhedrovirus]
MRVNSLRSQRFLCIWVLDSEATFLQCKKSGSAPARTRVQLVFLRTRDKLVFVRYEQDADKLVFRTQ